MSIYCHTAIQNASGKNTIPGHKTKPPPRIGDGDVLAAYCNTLVFVFGALLYFALSILPSLVHLVIEVKLV